MTGNDELVERMAEAIFTVSNGRHAGTRDEMTWENLDGFGEIGATVKANVRAKARAALAVAEPVIRERCARIALCYPTPVDAGPHEAHGRDMSAVGIAAAIRTGATS